MSVPIPEPHRHIRHAHTSASTSGSPTPTPATGAATAAGNTAIATATTGNTPAPAAATAFTAKTVPVSGTPINPPLMASSSNRTTTAASASAAPQNSTKTTRSLWTSCVFRQAFSSTVGAAVTATVVTPLDVVKVRVQSHVCIPVGGVTPCADPGHVSGSWDAMRLILRTEGVRGLWRGLNITLLLAIPTTGMYFTFYDALRTTLPLSDKVKEQHPWVATSVAGAVARMVSATVVSPLELARTNLQAGSQYKSVFGVLHDVRCRYGIAAWWRGLGPTLVRDAPFSAIYWSSYELLKSEKRSPLPKRMFRPGNELLTYLAAGVGAGSLAALCTIPADVVKTRRQTGLMGDFLQPDMTTQQHMHVHNHLHHHHHRHHAPARSSVSAMTQCVDGCHTTTAASSTGKATASGAGRGVTSIGVVQEIIATEGLRGLFKGVGPRMAKIAPACAIMMGTFETVKRYLGDID